MANTCFYYLVAVSKSKENLERLVNIMKNKDKEYFIYRCFDAYEEKITFENGFYRVRIEGDVAWSTSKWFNNEEDKKLFICLGYETDKKGNKNYSKPIYGTAHYASLTVICKVLDIGLECFADEEGIGFQSHDAINHIGKVVTNESVDWHTVENEVVDYDDEGNECIVTTHHKEGGYGDKYGRFRTIEEIYG